MYDRMIKGMHNSVKIHSNNLTMGNLWVNIWQISWPMFLIMLLNFFVGLTDVYVAGFISPEIQAVVGFVNQIYFLIIIIANAVSIGTLALVSRAFGAGKTEKAVETAKQSLLFSALIALGLMAAGLFFTKEIISTSGFPAKLSEIAENFLKIFALALGPNYILIISNAVFRASGEMKKPLVTMFIVSVINIIGNFSLVFGIFLFPKMGYIGIAISSAISVTIGMAINLSFFFTKPWRSIYARPWSMSAVTINKMIKLGWPAVLLQIAWNSGSLVLYNILSRLDDRSIVALASITNGLRIEAVIYLPAFALNMAASVLIGQNLGGNNPDRAEKIGWKIALTGMTLITLMALGIFIWADTFASLISKDPAVLEETTRYLRINMLSEPLMALGVILAGGMQGAGDTKGTMWVIVIAMWMIRLPLAYFLAIVLNYGAPGVWIAMVTSMNIQGILMTWRFRRGHWKESIVE
jgi:putative MATE family efflux protein